jgi:hypothetical protein
MAAEQPDDFERRVLALVRSQVDNLDRDYPDGWEITDFVITARFYHAPDPNAERFPWEGGPYPGWTASQWTRGSATGYWIDAELLEEALGNTHAAMADSDEDDPEGEDADTTSG